MGDAYRTLEDFKAANIVHADVATLLNGRTLAYGLGYDYPTSRGGTFRLYQPYMTAVSAAERDYMAGKESLKHDLDGVRFNKTLADRRSLRRELAGDLRGLLGRRGPLLLVGSMRTTAMVDVLLEDEVERGKLALLAVESVIAQLSYMAKAGKMAKALGLSFSPASPASVIAMHARLVQAMMARAPELEGFYVSPALDKAIKDGMTMAQMCTQQPELAAEVGRHVRN
ncbi:MAG: hypothetical protein GC129_00340 [Proteobacteria bacterium]|nr:hypothetical protein [Pseudomonadota bacterium]